MSVKIGIMGTHGVGKTTMALDMASRLKTEVPDRRVEVLAEVARSCPFPINEKMTDVGQRWIYHRQMLNEIEQEARCDWLVCDRTAMDNLAYSKWAGFDSLVAKYFPAAAAWLETYDTLYFLRPSYHGPCADGVRSTDATFRREIDQLLAVWVEQLGVDVIDNADLQHAARPEFECIWRKR